MTPEREPPKFNGPSRILRPRPQQRNGLTINDEEDENDDYEDDDVADGSYDDEEDNDDGNDDGDGSGDDNIDNEEKQKQMRTRRSGPELFFPDDIKSQRERALAALNTYLGDPLDDHVYVSVTTAGRRDYHMKAWRRYHRDVLNIDPDNIWLDLCRGTEEAIAYCRTFFKGCIENSVRKFVILGSQEFEYRRTLNSASAVTQMWRNLIAMADSQVLAKLRRKDRANPGLWRLKFVDHAKERGTGPVFEISKWIYTGLAVQFGLDTKPLTPKVLFTAADVLILLRILWERAPDIVCDPDSRLAFHAITLIMALGGFRPGSVMGKIPYKYVSMALVRHPEDRTRIVPVATISVRRNKMKHTISFRRDDIVDFSVVPVPLPEICLTSLVLARAFADDAFEPSFRTTKDLLHRPDLENTDFLPLKWKDELRERPIFKMTYSKYNTIWHRLLLVAGLRQDTRIYGLRVGAAGRLDGVLEPALRNYIMSHTTQVFESSYQTRNIRADLMSIAFDGMTRKNDPIFAMLSNTTLGRDAGAPIDVSDKDLLEFEQRKDVSDIRASIEAAKLAGKRDRKSLNPLMMKVRNLIQTLSSLKVQEKREQYFERVNRLRALGKPTTTASMPASQSSPIKHIHHGLRQQHFRALAAVTIARFCQRRAQELEKLNGNLNRPGQLLERSSEQYIQILAGYLMHKPVEESVETNETDEPTERGSDFVERLKVEIDGNNDQQQPQQRKHGRKKREKSRCLLGCGTYCHRPALTKHYKDIHVRKGTLESPFWCPECRRLGMKDTWIDGGPPAWSNHVETMHGKIHAPNLPTIPPSPSDLTKCLICESVLTIGRGFKNHFKILHINKNQFGPPFPCPECIRHGKEESKVEQIEGLEAWEDHVERIHGGLQTLSGEVLQSANSMGKRKRRKAAIQAEANDTEDDSSRRQRRRTSSADYCSRNISEVSTLVDVSANTSPEPTTDEDIEIISRIDPGLL